MRGENGTSDFLDVNYIRQCIFSIEILIKLFNLFGPGSLGLVR